MSMTPERLNDLKTTPIQMWLDKDRVEVLAALEESQQQVKDLKEDKRKIFAVHDEQCARSSEYYNELIIVKGQLKEAQQEAHKQNAEAKRLNEICNQLAGEEKCCSKTGNMKLKCKGWKVG